MTKSYEHQLGSLANRLAPYFVDPEVSPDKDDEELCGLIDSLIEHLDGYDEIARRSSIAENSIIFPPPIDSLNRIKEGDYSITDMEVISVFITRIQECIEQGLQIGDGDVSEGQGHGLSDEMLSLFIFFLDEVDTGYLPDIDKKLTEAEADGFDPEKIDELFRFFHSIKGGAGIFTELKDLVDVAHDIETLLGLCRDGRARADGRTLDHAFEAAELVGKIVARAREAIVAGQRVKPGGEGAVFHRTLCKEISVHLPEYTCRGAREQNFSRAETPGSSLAQRSVVGNSIRKYIKIDLKKIDDLVEALGELAIAESMIIHSTELERISPMLRTTINKFSRINRDLQYLGIKMRAVSIKDSFNKISLLIREQTRKSGKRIELITDDGNVEMDRNMMEMISDPLIHLVRNAIDHGIESPEERLAAGKSETGVIRLSASYESGGIGIEIGDDGRGIDREGVRRRAIELGLLSENEKIKDADLLAFIFHPGFSTKTEVTDLSGRGVGMDIVRKNIENLHGRVILASEPGGGTTIRLIMPLTLAIIDGLLGVCGPESYIFPALSVIESVHPTAEMIKHFQGEQKYIILRDEMIPLLFISDLFDIKGARRDITESLVVVVDSMTRRYGLVVDDIISHLKVVIKNLDAEIDSTDCFSGATITPDGKVGLILNLDKIAEQI